MSAYGKGDLKVDKRHVLHAIDDTQGLTRPRELQPLLWAGVATLALLTGYLVYSGVGL